MLVFWRLYKIAQDGPAFQIINMDNPQLLADRLAAPGVLADALPHRVCCVLQQAMTTFGAGSARQ